MSSGPSRSPFGQAPTPDEIVRRLHQLPSAPRVLPKLKKLLSDGNSSMHDVVHMIRLDPGIAARVLQMGNSAYYSQGLRCYSVDEAVTRVGYDQVYELVANAVASQVLVRPLAVYGLEADQLWHRSIACGIAAELLATRINADRDIAYTTGLLHGVGLVAIDEWAFRHQPGLHFAGGGLPLETCEAERAVLGFHNAEVAAALLRLWEFPAGMSEPVRWQYLPRGTAAHFTASAIVHVARWLRTAVCQTEPVRTLPEAGILRALKLNPDSLTGLSAEVQRKVDSLNSLLEVDHPDTAVVHFPNGKREISGHGSPAATPVIASGRPRNRYDEIDSSALATPQQGLFQIAGDYAPATGTPDGSVRQVSHI